MFSQFLTRTDYRFGNLGKVVRVFCLLAISTGVVCAEPVADEPEAPAKLSEPRVPHPAKRSVDEDSKDTNSYGEQATNGLPQDVYEMAMRQAMADTRRQLEAPGLDTNTQHFLEGRLKQDEGLLASHQAQVQREAVFVQSIRANPRTGWTNMPDPGKELFSRGIEQYERELADPALPAHTRHIDELMLKSLKQRLADRNTDFQLWANLRMARERRNPEQIAQAERQLADYLSAKLGRIQGKQYPPGMSLDAIIKQYEIQAGGGKFDRRRIVIAALVVVALVPAAFLVFRTLRRKV